MGSSSSRLDRFAGTYEKSFARIEKDVEQLKSRTAARTKRKVALSRWCNAAVALALAVAAAVIYQVQQKPYGTYTHQQHLYKVGGAMAIPTAAFAIRWVLFLLMTLAESRDSRKLKSLEAAKRGMIRELKDMTRFDKIKSLIDKFDPDARPPNLPPAKQLAGNYHGSLHASASYPQAGHQQLMQQQRTQQVVPALLMKGSGQVAGAAALAMAGAGKALMPMFDKLATTLISENPMLLEDLRNSKLEALKAMIREGDALLDSCNAKLDSISLKHRLAELEQKMDQSPSYDMEVLEAERQQYCAQAADVQRVQEQLHQQLQQHFAQQGAVVVAPESALRAAATTGANGCWPSEAGGMLVTASGSWESGEGSQPTLLQAAISAAETPCTAGAAAGSAGSAGDDMAGAAGALVEQGSGGGQSGMGEGLQGAADDQLFQAGAATGVRQRKAACTTLQ